MNILFSCDEYPPAKTGGIGKATKVVAENLAARGHNVYVINGRFDKSLPEESVINCVTIFRICLMQKISWLFKDNFICERIRTLAKNLGILSYYAIKEYETYTSFIEQIIAKHKIDLIENPDYTILSEFFSSYRLLGFHRYSVPSVARVHGSISFLKYYREGKLNPVSKANDFAFFNSVDRILAVSRFAGEFVNDILGVQNKCDVIYNPLVNQGQEIHCENKAVREKKIVFLGKITETKGAFNLIEAFNRFSLSHKEYRLVMIGGGDIEKGKKLVTPEIADKVTFTGYLSAEKIASYLSKAAFCVIPSYFENFSMAALEVMGRGNILIYTKESSGPEVIEDGVNGFLVDPRDVDEILEKMNYVADNIDKLAPMRDVARRSIEKRFAEDVIVDQLEKYYSDLLK